MNQNSCLSRDRTFGSCIFLKTSYKRIILKLILLVEDGSPVDTHEQTLLFKRIQVIPNGTLRDIQSQGKLGNSQTRLSSEYV